MRLSMILLISFALITISFFGCVDIAANSPLPEATQAMQTQEPISTSTNQPKTSAAIATKTPQPTPRSTPFIISEGTQVFLGEEELAPILPLFKGYLEEDEVLYYAVSTHFNNEPFVIGFVYELDDYYLLFRDVVGLKQTQDGFEEAFVSSEYDNPRGLVAEDYYDLHPYQLAAFEHAGYVVVKADDSINPDMGLHTIFVVNESGLLSNYITTSFTARSTMISYDNKLLLQEGFVWYDFSVQNEEIVLSKLDDFSSYIPEMLESDFAISLKDYQSKKYDSEKDEYYGENYIFLDINGEDVTIDGFNGFAEDSGWGDFWVYESKEIYSMQIGGSLIFLYTPSVEIECHISKEEDFNGFHNPIYSSLPGNTVASITESGLYRVQINSNSEVYIIYIDVED